jgi:membrane protein YqaA with SNARE-associated domain
MMEIGIFEALTFILLSAVKILFTPIGMIAAGYSYWTTIAITSFGGVLGCVVFFYLGKGISKLFKSKKEKKTFTKQNRWIVRTKNSFGLLGMSATMGVISVPLATILVAKYFGKKKIALPALILSAIAWSFAVTTVSYLIATFFK